MPVSKASNTKNAMSFVCMLSNVQTAASFLIAVNCDVLQCMLLRAMVPMVGHSSRPALQLHLLAQHITVQKKVIKQSEIIFLVAMSLFCWVWNPFKWMFNVNTLWNAYPFIKHLVTQQVWIRLKLCWTKLNRVFFWIVQLFIKFWK